MTSVATTLGTGSTTSTDNQSFCYDEQNRLVWATCLTATGPNGCASNTAGSLTAAGYTQPFTYDTLDRLTSNDVGSYAYGPALQAATNPAPLHSAQTVTGRNYTATYDAAGNMVCRAPNSTLTCAAGQTATGQQLGYDAAGRLTSWQDGTESPPNVAVTYAYDGAGSRVAQHVVSFGSAWTTAYLLGDTAETTEGSGTFTDYLVVPGVGTVVETNSPSSPALSYLATDGLNSVSVALDALGSVSGQALYLPYGPGRYFTGRFPTTHGFTGQDQDGNSTGLFYDHARYYDPSIGQFAQADTYDGGGGGGLNRFAYVDDNPASRTDPTGHCWLVCAVIAAVATTVVVTAVDAAVQYATTGKVDVGSALKTGATAGLMVGAAIALGPAAAAVEGTIAGGLGGGAVASVAAAATVGAVEGAAFQVGDNVVSGRDWREGVGQAALIGGASAGVLSGAGEALGALRAARALRAASEDAGDVAGDAAARSYWTKSEELGQRVYKRDDLIDPDLVTADGRTNLNRMLDGDAPIGPDGNRIQLHHMLQTDDSPLAEVSQTFHQQYKSIIHINPSTVPSGITRSAFDSFRTHYWTVRALDFMF